ncbi:MAG TPA: amidohydrolase family protein [Candidatus Bathyarchaeia archaeon]|nr:amidohydrolase family protein [Candidatus Bathyarchaeia archaeon]
MPGLSHFRCIYSLVLLICLVTAGNLWAQAQPVAIVGGTLIDGTGRAAIVDSAIVMQEGRFTAVGKRGEVSLPQGAEVIDAKGKTILPGLIDGHCHLRDWMGEVYLHFGVVICPTISNNPVDWVIAQREGVRNGTIRAPRVWAGGNVIDGPPPEGLGALRRQRTSIIVQNEEEARKAVRMLADKGVDGYKFFERLSPQVAKAGAEEAHRLGRPVIAHSLDIFVAADAGYQSVEHSWSVAYTSIQDPKKKAELDSARMNRKITTAEVHAYMEPEMFDRIIKAMVAKNIHWSPTWGTTFRALSPRAQQMKQQEVTLLKDPGLRYLPSYILKASEQHFAYFENASPDKRAQLLSGYTKVQDFARRFIAAGGKVHLGSDPDNILAGWGVNAELQLLVDAGLTAVQAVQSASLNVAQAWGKQKDYGSVEKGKIADLVIVRGDPTKDIFATQDVEKVFMDGKSIDTSFHPDYKNPVPRPIEDRPEL